MKINYKLTDLTKVAAIVLDQSKSKIITFKGAMGAGKTTLIKEIVKILGINEVTNSPTFSLVNQYESPANLIVYHFDFYRIEHETEAMDMGIEEYFDSGAWCLIEWPDKIKNLLPLELQEVNIEIISEDERCIEITHYG